MGLSLSHVVLVLVVFLVLFGVGKLPRLMGDLAKGIKSFRQGMREGEDESPEHSHPKNSHGHNHYAEELHSAHASHKTATASKKVTRAAPRRAASALQTKAKVSVKTKVSGSPASAATAATQVIKQPVNKTATVKKVAPLTVAPVVKKAATAKAKSATSQKKTSASVEKSLAGSQKALHSAKPSTAVKKSASKKPTSKIKT